MKVLSILCSFLYVLSLMGKYLFPAIFSNAYVFWVTKLALVILLAIGFAHSLSKYFQKDSKKIRDFSASACFLFLFLNELIPPIMVHYGVEAANTFEANFNRPSPIRDTSSPHTEHGRKFFAGLLFEDYGVKIPYKLDSGEFKVFEPTAEGIDKYRAKVDQQKEMIELELQLSQLARSSLYLSMLQTIFFFIVFVGTVLYEQNIKNTATPDS